MAKQENIFTIVEQERISLTKATTKLKKMVNLTPLTLTLWCSSKDMTKIKKEKCAPTGEMYLQSVSLKKNQYPD